MKFEKSNPILYSTDVKRSIRFYTEILGFEDSWEWGNPVDFGGISKDGVEIFFCLNNQGHPGTWIAIIMDDVDAYYAAIKDKGAEIISPPETMEFNIREMLVRDPDGHILRFGHRTDCD
ncbi:MAG: bleomycin resistance family protein [Cyclobacteriaceae bacterium]|nr:bleomycin resistance family protein [Cyclobacteriaceae bacterium]